MPPVESLPVDDDIVRIARLADKPRIVLLALIDFIGERDIAVQLVGAGRKVKRLMLRRTNDLKPLVERLETQLS